jgi:preprotein translocase subunit YajC
MIIDFLISSAHAQEAAAGAMPSGSPLSSIIPLVFIFGVFYILIIRPQQKKHKEHQAMIGAVQRGDNIITGGGIHAKVTRVDEGGKVKVQIAEGIEVTIEQSTIASVQAKPGAAGEKDKTGKTKPKAANDNA